MAVAEPPNTIFKISTNENIIKDGGFDNFFNGSDFVSPVFGVPNSKSWDIVSTPPMISSSANPLLYTRKSNYTYNNSSGSVGLPGSSFITQSVETVPYMFYNVSFYTVCSEKCLTDVACKGALYNNFNITKKQQFPSDNMGTLSNALEQPKSQQTRKGSWHYVTWIFQASQNNTNITIGNAILSDSNCFPIIDQMSMTRALNTKESCTSYPISTQSQKEEDLDPSHDPNPEKVDTFTINSMVNKTKLDSGLTSESTEKTSKTFITPVVIVIASVSTLVLLLGGVYLYKRNEKTLHRILNSEKVYGGSNSNPVGSKGSGMFRGSSQQNRDSKEVESSHHHHPNGNFNPGLSPLSPTFKVTN